MSSALSKPAKHSAPGQYLGFALQPVRLFFHLLVAPPDAQVSLEHLDDVAVHYYDGGHLVEQTKSALAQNPLANLSNDLWKTISNWMTAISTGVLCVETTKFQLYVVPAKKHGKWSRLLHAADTAEQVIALTKAIRKELAAKEEEPACMPYLKIFLDATDAERYELVKRVEIVSTSDDPLHEILEVLAPTIPGHLLEVICRAGIGMAKEEADRLIRRKLPALVNVGVFRKAFHAFVQKNNIPGYLASMCKAPDDSTLQKVWTGKPDFVRQLEFIKLPDEQQLRAVSDLLRTSADKALWAESGIVFDGSFDDWDDTLIKRHSAVEGEVHDLHSDKPEDLQGRLIYNRCALLQIALDGRAVPGHFALGSFNALAEERLLGWHPRYADLFSKDSE